MSVYDHPSIRPLREKRESMLTNLKRLNAESGTAIAEIAAHYSDSLWDKIGELEIAARKQRDEIDTIDAQIEADVRAIIAHC